MSAPHPIRQSQYLVLDNRIIDEVIAAELTLGEITKHPQNPPSAATMRRHLPESSGTRLKSAAYRLCPLKT